MIYYIVHCLLQQEINFYDFLSGLHNFSILGNPSWFILMTLLIYLLTYTCFKLCRHTAHVTAISLLTGILIITIYLVPMLKPSHWANTLLCFPAGMFYSLKGEQIKGLLKKTKVPGIIYALFFIALGRYLYRSGLSPIIYVQNVAGILFALGVTWFAGSFRWQNPSRILIWLGGSGLFTVYMFRMLPMRVITQLGCNDANPYLVWFCVVATTALLISVSTPLYKKINLFLFSKS